MSPLDRNLAISVCVLLLSGQISTAGDWECLHKLCGHKSCNQSTRVTLPARDVEVVTEQPRVVVREVSPSREVAVRSRRAVDLGSVPVGTVYMPLAMPTVGFGAIGFGGVGGGTREVVREAEDEIGQLESAHRAERAAIRRREALQDELELAVDNHRRAIEKRGATRGGSSSEVEKKLAELTEGMKQMNERVTAVEKLLIYHDNYLRGQRGQVPATTSGPDSNPNTSTQPTAPQTETNKSPAMAPPLPPR